MVLLRDDRVHPATYEMFLLLEETAGFIQGMRVQARQEPTFPAALLRIIQKEFNERFHHHFLTDTGAMYGGRVTSRSTGYNNMVGEGRPQLISVKDRYREIEVMGKGV